MYYYVYIICILSDLYIIGIELGDFSGLVSFVILPIVSGFRCGETNVFKLPTREEGFVELLSHSPPTTSFCVKWMSHCTVDCPGIHGAYLFCFFWDRRHTPPCWAL